MFNATVVPPVGPYNRCRAAAAQHGVRPWEEDLVNWLDFSGAPAMLIPERTARFWAGANESNWDDYDRACDVAWPGRGVIAIADSTGFVFYSESDSHTWISEAETYASGGWIPNPLELENATWENPVTWEAREEKYILVNSAEDLRYGLPEKEFFPVCLARSFYLIEYAYIESEFIGQFSRLRSVRL